MNFNIFSKFHPLVNFIFFLTVIVSVVTIQHPLYIVTSLTAGICYYILLDGKKGTKKALALLPVSIIIATINPLFNRYGEHILFHIFNRPYTLEALLYGLTLGGIFIDTIIWFACYSRVLTGDKFTALFGRLIPSLSLILVMLFQMIPNFTKKAKQIILSRKSIGKGINSGSTFKEKVRDGATIISIMTDWSLENSIIIADSMKARGYGSKKRTNYNDYTFTKKDAILLSTIIILLITLFFSANTRADFTPKISIEPFSLGIIIYGILTFIPTIIEIKETIVWHILKSKI